MARLYADENFDFPIVLELRRLGDDVVAAHGVGQAHRGLSDAQQLAYAISDSRAILTFNRRDFVKLHKQIVAHKGIIVCTNDNDVVALADRIHRAITALPSLDNKLVRVNKPSRP